MKSFSSDFPDNTASYHYTLTTLNAERANTYVHFVGKVQSFLSLSLDIHALTTEQ